MNERSIIVRLPPPRPPLSSSAPSPDTLSSSPPPIVPSPSGHEEGGEAAKTRTRPAPEQPDQRTRINVPFSSRRIATSAKAARKAVELPSLRQRGLLGPPGYSSNLYLHRFCKKPTWPTVGSPKPRPKRPKHPKRSSRSSAVFSAPVPSYFAPQPALATTSSDRPQNELDTLTVAVVAQAKSAAVCVSVPVPAKEETDRDRCPQAPPFSDTTSTIPASATETLASAASLMIASPSHNHGDGASSASALSATPPKDGASSASALAATSPNASSVSCSPSTCTSSLPSAPSEQPATPAASPSSCSLSSGRTLSSSSSFSSPSAPPSFPAQLLVQTSSRTLVVRIGLDEAVEAFADAICAKLNVASRDFYLSYGGKILRTKNMLAEYGIQSGSCIMLSERLVGGAGNTHRIVMTSEDWDREQEMEDISMLSESEVSNFENGNDFYSDPEEEERTSRQRRRAELEIEDAYVFEPTHYGPSFRRVQPRYEDYQARLDKQALSSAKRQRTLTLREKLKKAKQDVKKYSSANVKYFNQIARLQKNKDALERQVRQLQEENERLRQSAAPSNRGRTQKRAARSFLSNRQENLLSEMASLNDGMLDSNAAEPMQQVYEQVVHDRSFEELYAPAALENAKAHLHLVDLSEPTPADISDHLPDVLFRLAPSVTGNAHIYAASKLVTEPIRAERQFPGFGTALFGTFFEVLHYCDRWHLDLFTISRAYLPLLLTSDAVRRWAESPAALGVLRVSHWSAARVYPLVESANQKIALHLRKLGFELAEASRPRLVLEQVQTRDAPAYHSKALTAISTDGSTLFTLDGSGNPSAQGFGGVATAADGSAQPGSSHETMTRIATPALSVFAQTRLQEETNFLAGLGREGRIYPVNKETAAPITNDAELETATSTLKEMKKTTGVRAAEKEEVKARGRAWDRRLQVIAPYTFSRLIYEPAPAPQIALFADPTAAAECQLPQIAEKLVLISGSRATSGQWHHQDLKEGESLKEYLVGCMDCRSALHGTMPPSRIKNYSIRHLPANSPCADKLGVSRSWIIEAGDGAEERMQQAFDALQATAIQHPVTGQSLINPILVWYSRLTEDLDGYDRVLYHGHLEEAIRHTHSRVHCPDAPEKAIRDVHWRKRNGEVEEEDIPEKAIRARQPKEKKGEVEEVDISDEQLDEDEDEDEEARQEQAEEADDDDELEYS
ncbi:hypothetical protein JCM10908_005694 [Rhodotorula pacifica]|uniref:uncharacterized protein n=1 Tax=Rhodotorula pacifica TaxID=1495444 RepID=UPI0031820BF1